jgi:hypothetical protein
MGGRGWAILTNQMKQYKAVIFLAGLLGGLCLGLLAAWLFYISWRINHTPPYFYDKIPSSQSRLHIDLFNSCEVPIDAVVLLDGKSIMGGLISGKGPFLFFTKIPFLHNRPFPAINGFSSGLSPELGKHEISVRTSNAGLLAKQYLTQEIGITNYISIYVQDRFVGTNRFSCNIFVRTNRIETDKPTDSTRGAK